MKIYIIPLDKRLQPEKIGVKYPNHNDNYGVEQDFFKFLNANKHLITTNPMEADFHYLPIFWTNWHISHNYAKTGIDDLELAVRKAILDDKKTFTICQYDDGPIIELGQTILFLASRKTKTGIDIPLLCKKHRKPFFKTNKKYLASFLGKVRTSEIRRKMVDILKDKKEFFIYEGNNGSRFFVKKILESYVTLSPRGYGGSSFRLFESMQLGVTPFLVGDLDTRPFKKYIDWESCSFYTNDPKNIIDILANTKKEDLIMMGEKSLEIYDTMLSYQKWCNFVIKELEDYGNNP
jgi:hypothetical protein